MCSCSYFLSATRSLSGVVGWLQGAGPLLLLLAAEHGSTGPGPTRSGVEVVAVVLDTRPPPRHVKLTTSYPYCKHNQTGHLGSTPEGPGRLLENAENEKRAVVGCWVGNSKLTPYGAPSCEVFPGRDSSGKDGPKTPLKCES